MGHGGRRGVVRGREWHTEWSDQNNQSYSTYSAEYQDSAYEKVVSERVLSPNSMNSSTGDKVV